MLIKEKDFQIQCEHKCYTLYLITKNGGFKIKGYYLNIENAFKAVIKFRKDKKYLGSEKPEDLDKIINEFLLLKEELNKITQL